VLIFYHGARRYVKCIIPIRIEEQSSNYIGIPASSTAASPPAGFAYRTATRQCSAWPRPSWTVMAKPGDVGED